MSHLSADDAIAAAEWIGLAISALGGVFALGRLSAQYKQLQAGVVAIHRRIDEMEHMLLGLREALIAAGMLRPSRSAPSRPPLALTTRDEDPTPS